MLKFASNTLLEGKNFIKFIFGDIKMLFILLLGMVSAVPLVLVTQVLSIWLREKQIDLTSIGMIAAITIPYSFKFLWAPLIDHGKIPVLYKLFGRRRSWLIFSLTGIIISIFMLSSTEPTEGLYWIHFFGFCVAFFSATFDIVYDGFRIELVESKLQAMAVSVCVFGYRMGMIFTSVGGLYLAHNLGWNKTYEIFGLCLSIGYIIILLAEEPKNYAKESKDFKNFEEYLEYILIAPFKDFLKRPGSLIIIAFIILYKLGDVMLASMSGPFFIEMQYTKAEIANVVKFYGFISTLLGSYVGGIIMMKKGGIKALLICGFFQMLANSLYCIPHHWGHDTTVLGITNSIENFTMGMGTAALIGYMSSLCNLAFSATQYALLSSLASFARTTLSTPAGYFVKLLGWDQFFIFTTVISLPALLLIYYYSKNYNHEKIVDEKIA